MVSRSSKSGSKRKGAQVSPTKRVALYLRARHLDPEHQLRCTYCGALVTVKGNGRGAAALDHYDPAARGGDQDPGNLVVCCTECNSAKKHRSTRAWWGYCRAVRGWSEERITGAQRRVAEQRHRTLAPFWGWAKRAEENPALLPWQ